MIAADITAVICTRERYDVLPRAIDSLLAQQRIAEPRILVIDNSPDQEAARGFGRRYAGRPGLDYQVRPAAGLSMARNAALEAARTRFIAFMDDDAVAAPGWLAELQRAFQEGGDAVAIVGGRVLPEWESPRPPWLHDELLGYLSIVDWGGSLREALPAEYLAGTNIAFRGELLRRAGGFSPQLGRGGSGAHLLSNEEIEAATRVEALGGRRFYQPEACVTHRVPLARLSQAWFRKRIAWQAVSEGIADAEKMRRKLERNFSPEARRALGSVPLRGLHAQVDDAELFRGQMRALYFATAQLLLGAGPDF